MTSMEEISHMSDPELGSYAMDVLAREVGLVGFARFIRIYQSGSGDYTHERRRLFANMDMEEVFARLNPSAG